MASAKSYAMLTAVALALQAIKMADGYLTDMGTNVWTEDNQRTEDDALGLTVLMENISGSGLDHERPGKPLRVMDITIEAAIPADIDQAQAKAHAAIEDMEAALAKMLPPVGMLAPAVLNALLLQRPDGMPVVVAQMHVRARYAR